MRVTDPPSGLITVTGVTVSTGATCPTPTVGQPFDCVIGDLAPGATATLTFTGTLAAATPPQQLTNVAQVSTTSVDPVLTNNVGSATVPIVQSADLQIAKTADPAHVPPGSTITYTLTARNNGPSVASNVVISDTVPNASQLTLIGVSSDDADCPVAPSALSVQCTVATLAVGATAAVEVTAYVAPSVSPGTVQNGASVTSSTPDTTPGNNQVTPPVTIDAPVADVGITKDASETAIGGGSVAYTLTATNHGPSDAADVAVTDLLPEDVTVTAVTTNRGICTITPGERQLITCTVPALPGPAGPGPGAVGAAMEVRITGTVDADAALGDLENAAEVSTSSDDPDEDNDAAEDMTEIGAEADVQVTKTADRTTIPIGAPGSVTYTVAVRNNGPSYARGVTLEDRVPSPLEFVSTETPAGVTCDEPVPEDAEHDLLTCAVGDIPVGEARLIEVTLETTAPTGLPVETPPLTEIASVTSTSTDADDTNDEARWTLSGASVTDIAITKTASTALVAGALVTYSLTVRNTDTSNAAGPPTITDVLPAGLTFVPAGEPGSQTSAACDASGQTVTCALDDPLDPQQQVQVLITVRLAATTAAGATVANTARVTTPTTEASLANNVSTTSGLARTTADLDVDDSVTITSPDTAPGAYDGAGSARDVVFTVTNHGPSVARDVEFRFGITPDVIVTALPTGALPGSCSLVNLELVCKVDNGGASTLGPEESVTVTVPVQIASYQPAGSWADTVPGAYVNVATTTSESTLTNNRDTAAVGVGAPRTDLQIDKEPLTSLSNPEDDDPAFVAGGPFSYQVTVSVGEDGADAQEVVMTDTTPPGFRATSANTNQGTCGIADADAEGDGRLVTCAIGRIRGVGESLTPQVVTITITGVVDSDDEGHDLGNTATATSSTPDLDGAASEVGDTAIVDVLEHADLQMFKSADAPVSYAGGSVGYTLPVVNAGPSSVEEAYVTDTLPVGVSLDAASSPGCAVQSGDPPATRQVVRCEVGVIAVGAGTSIRVVGTTPPNDLRQPGTPPPEDPADEHPREITNSATAASGAFDPDTGNDTATATSEIDKLADIAVTSFVSTTTPAAGGQLVYTFTGINNGPSAGDHGRSKLVLPPGFELDRSGDHPLGYVVPDVDCVEGSEGDPPQVTISCESRNVPPYYDIFLPGISLTGVVYVTIPADTRAGTYVAEQNGTTTTPESGYDNNVARPAVNVQLVSDTTITKTLVEPNPIVAGKPVVYRLTATNDGPSISPNIVISDTVPKGTRFRAAEVRGGLACPVPDVIDEDSIIRCPVGVLEPGESASALITLDVPKDFTGELCNAALVGSGSLDPDFADNEQEACGSVFVPPATDVGVTVTAEAAQLRPGETARFEAVVRNNDPAAATGTVVTFAIPDGLTDVSGALVSASDGTSPAASCVVGSLRCTIGALAPGQQVTYRIAGTVRGDPGRSVTLTGTVAHDELDGDPGNDTAGATVTLFADTPAVTPAPSPGASPTPTRTPSPRASRTPTPTRTPSRGSSPGGGSGGGLPLTGANLLAVGVLGIAAMLGGGALRTASRRRRD